MIRTLLACLAVAALAAGALLLQGASDRGGVYCTVTHQDRTTGLGQSAPGGRCLPVRP